MKRDHFKTIDLRSRCCSEALYSRLIWQVLFDEYRNNGGDLDFTDSLLCDYDGIQRRFQRRRDASDMFVKFSFRWVYGVRGCTSIEDFDPWLGEYGIWVDVDLENMVINFYRESE